MRHEMFTEALVKIVEKEEVLSMKWIVMLSLAFVILSLGAVYTLAIRYGGQWRILGKGRKNLGPGT